MTSARYYGEEPMWKWPWYEDEKVKVNPGASAGENQPFTATPQTQGDNVTLNLNGERKDQTKVDFLIS